MSEAVYLKGIHHVELAVGNAKQAAYYYRHAFGFRLAGYRGPETGCRETASWALVQGDVRFVVTSPLGTDHPYAEHQRRHGDGVVDVAFEVKDLDAAFGAVRERGAPVAAETRDVEDAAGAVRLATVRTWADTVHTLVECRGYSGPLLPGFDPVEDDETGVGLWRIDHIVGNVEDRKMDVWVDWYSNVFGFQQFLSFDDKDISAEFTALRSKVMASPTGAIKMPINEPADGRKKSQIQEYVEFYGGAGVQHVALFTDDIVSTVAQLRDRGVDFLYVPDSCYDTVWDAVGDIREDREEIRRHGILVDRDDEGYLLQLFTKPVQDRPTLFFEIIQRREARGFGKGNFKALFESIEREQGRRGNL